MKPSTFDRLIGLISPRMALRRMQYKAAYEVLLGRAYDSAKSYSTSDWVSATKSDANREIKGAQKVLQEKSRDLGRNSPYAARALNVIVSNTVGAGIVANIRGKNKTQTKKLVQLWKEITESSKCDAEGRHDFYGLQALMMRTLVESGEGLALKQISLDAPSIRILESDFIVTDKDTENIIQGIELDSAGRRLKYHLYKKHPGSDIFKSETTTVEASKLAHVYRQDRPGQFRGVPWSHSVIETLKDLQDYQATTLMRQKVAACFVGFITNNGQDSPLSNSDKKALRESEMQLQPATFRYMNQGEDVKFANPPGVEGYNDFVREAMRAVAAGYGISYEAMTGDYSQVNFSSGRMGHIEFRRNIDSWRWNILIPQFCDPFFRWFLEWAKMKGVDVKDATVEWVPPAHVMIDPTKEIRALREEVRAGFKTYGQAVREQGLDPDETVKEFAEWNQKFDDLKLSFDSDPRRLSNVGFAHPKDTLPVLSDAEFIEDAIEDQKPDETEEIASGQEDKEDASDSADPGGGD